MNSDPASSALYRSMDNQGTPVATTGLEQRMKQTLGS
jgi:hypothetical protein